MYLHNPWLTYGIGLHRLREAGLGTNLMDLLDEKAFDFNQIHAWCTEFFQGNQGPRIRHPNIDWSGFLADLQGLLKREKLVWNSVKNKLCPWINLEKLDSMYQRQSGINPRLYERPTTTRSSFRKSNSMPVRNRRSTMTSGVPPSFIDPKRSATADGPKRRSTFSHEASARPGTQPVSQSTPPAEHPTDLPSYIQHWSHIGPSFKKMQPLELLLVQVPTLFPPTNPFVEEHEYFSKWKTLSEDAFEGESGDGLKELLKRAARKAKFFLHPDKLPNDLSEDQKTLFKTIWDVVQESEAALLGE